MQCVRAQVAPKAVDPRSTGSGARSHHLEHPVGDLQANFAGGHLRGGDVQRALATLIFSDRVSAFPRSLQRLARDVRESLRGLKADKETAVIRQNVRIFRGTLRS